MTKTDYLLYSITVVLNNFFNCLFTFMYQQSPAYLKIVFPFSTYSSI